MEKESFITIEDSNRHYDDFVRFMDATTAALKLDAQNRQKYYLTRNGEKFETDVLKFMKAKAQDFNFNPKCIKKTKRQHFPDIISNNYFGVEVKTTEKNSWSTTGSSIVESMRKEEVKRILLLYGILSKDNIDFRCKPYEECLSGIHVTHSPRYDINMDLSMNGETIFNKMNITYDDFRNLGEQQINKVKEYYRGIYKSKKTKTMPWWIGDGDTVQDLMWFSDLDKKEKEKFISKCYALFPEILGNGSDKFRRPSLWMCTRYSVICSNVRDIFSSSGTGDIYVNGQLRWKSVSKVICTLTTVLEKIVEIYNNNSVIMEDFLNFAIYPKEEVINIEQWIEAAEENMRKTLKKSHPDLTIRSLMKLSYQSKKRIGNKLSYFLEKTK